MVAGLVLTACLAGCSSSTPSVGIVGDSITYLSEPAIAAALKGTDYDVQAIEGRTIAEMSPIMEDRIIKGPGGPPHALFVNLGTNDIIRGDGSWIGAWRTLMAETAAVPCEVLFTMNPFVGAYVHPGGPTVQDVNRAIAAAQRADPSRVHVIDWGAAVQANHDSIAAAQARGAPLPAPLIGRDGIHPTSAGRQWIAHHIASALVTDCRQ